MNLARALPIAAALALLGAPHAAAQFPPPPGQSAPSTAASPFPPPPGQAAPPPANSPFRAPPGQLSSSPFPAPPGQASSSPFPPVGGGPSGPPPSRAAAPGAASPFPQPGQPLGQNPCDAFLEIRQEAEKNANAIQAASKRKATREEVCPLFQRFAATEAKMVGFLEKNQQACGVPADAVKNAKATHVKTIQVRNNICSAGPAPAKPRGPSLSDAFGGPAMPDAAPKPGRGTFDTLTGNPLGR